MVDGGESTGLATASVLLREVEELRREVEELRREVEELRREVEELRREVEELRRVVGDDGLREVEELRRVVGDDGMCEGEAKLRGVDGLLRGMVGLYDFAEVGVIGDFTEAEVAIEELGLERGEDGPGTGFCFSARFMAA